MEFIGQRADKILVTDLLGVEDYEQANGIVKNGVVKEIEHYTMTCGECDGTGFYEEPGEVICEDCGMVLSGDRQPVFSTEFNADSDSMGSSRGLEKMGEVRGTHQPSGV